MIIRLPRSKLKHPMIRLARWTACVTCFLHQVPSFTIFSRGGTMITCKVTCVHDMKVTIVLTTPSTTPVSAPRSAFAVAGMMKTRSVTRNEKRLRTTNNGSAPWSDLLHELLFMVLMRLGVGDFVAFSGVCKSWRTFILSNWNKIMESRKPMYMSISTRVNNKCCLEDLEGKKFEIIDLPHSTATTCYGITRGYLILLGRKTRNFWLVNPITRHGLYIPGYPINLDKDPANVKAILVYSPLMSGWVFVICNKFGYTLAFSKVGKEAGWRLHKFEFALRDLHAFKGKIYTLHSGGRLFELNLGEPDCLQPLNMKNFPRQDNLLVDREFVSSSENLFLIRCMSKGAYGALEVDFDEMKWLLPAKSIENYALFLSDLKCNAAIKPDTWADPWIQYEKHSYMEQSKKKGSVTTDLWFFPHQFLNLKQPLSLRAAMSG